MSTKKQTYTEQQAAAAASLTAQIEAARAEIEQAEAARASAVERMKAAKAVYMQAWRDILAVKNKWHDTRFQLLPDTGEPLSSLVFGCRESDEVAQDLMIHLTPGQVRGAVNGHLR